MEYLYRHALAIGMSPEDFWNMSAGEAEQIIRSRRQEQLDEGRWQAQLVWMHGSLSSYAFNDPKKYPKLHEAFPGLFDSEKSKPKMDWKLREARMMAFMVAHNAKVKAGDEA